MQKIKELHSAVSHVMLLELDKWDVLVCWAIVVLQGYVVKSDLIWESLNNNNKSISLVLVNAGCMRKLPCSSFT